jgi:hypothetical protein
MSRPFRANSNIADPTDPTDPTDRSEKPIGQITNPHAIPSVKAATLQNFPRFPCFPWTKMGCGRQPAPSPFVLFVVKKEFPESESACAKPVFGS